MIVIAVTFTVAFISREHERIIVEFEDVFYHKSIEET